MSSLDTNGERTEGRQRQRMGNEIRQRRYRKEGEGSKQANGLEKEGEEIVLKQSSERFFVALHN